MFEELTGREMAAQIRPILSIVIVDSDGRRDTLNCLESIFRYPPEIEFEVILVDNCSEVSCLPDVQLRFLQVRTFTAPRRQGFSKNYNLGMRQARGDYILVLNNDTLIHAGALNRLLGAMRANPAYGIAGPRLLSSAGNVQTVCVRSLPTPFTYLLSLFLLDLSLPSGKLWDRVRQYRIDRMPGGPVPCISGACMLVSKPALHDAGYLDEGYDFYYEDIEWCHRFQKSGFKIGYVPGAQVTHLGDRSLSKVKAWAKRSEYLSAVRYFRQYKDISMFKIRLLWAGTVLGYLLRATVYTLLESISQERSHAEAYRQVFQWILTQLPAAAGTMITD